MQDRNGALVKCAILATLTTGVHGESVTCVWVVHARG